jgi:hypothetical protein
MEDLEPNGPPFFRLNKVPMFTWLAQTVWLFHVPHRSLRSNKYRALRFTGLCTNVPFSVVSYCQASLSTWRGRLCLRKTPR